MSTNKMNAKKKLNNNNNNSNNNTCSKKTNLNRLISFSDTNINYQANYDDLEEASGSTGLINSDGTLNLNMILKGAHSVVFKENSFKLCELVLNILENLINIDILPSEDIDNKLEEAKLSTTTLSEASISYLDTLETKFNENFYLAIDLAMRCMKWLGCTICQINAKNFLNDQLRGKIKFLLGRLHKKNPKRFKNFFKNFIQNNDINHVMDTFHALFGYCSDPYNGFNHYSPYITYKTTNGNLPTNLLYANNFGNNSSTDSTNQDTSVNIESVMIEFIMKPLIKRFIDLKYEVMNQENLYLFCDIRSFLSYVKENHGGLFRKVAFAALLEPLVKLKQENQQRTLRLEQIDEKLNELKKLRDSFAKLSETFTNNKSKTKAFFYDEEDDNEDNEDDDANDLDTLQQQQQAEVDDLGDNNDTDDEKSTSMRQQSQSQMHLNESESLVSSQVKKNLPKLSIDFNSMSIRQLEKLSPSMKSINKSDLWSFKKISDLGRPKKKETHSNPSTLPKKQDKLRNRSTTSINQMDTLDKQVDAISMSSTQYLSVVHSPIQKDNSDLRDISCSVSNTSSLLQIEFNESATRSSLKGKFQKRSSNQNGLKEVPSKSTMKINEAKNLDNSLSSKSSKDEDKNEIEILEHIYETTLQHRKKILNERRFVDVNIVYKGIEYYRFLMECLPPSTVPDVPFMSAILEIEAPVISKAAFLLETAYFVNRCNKKDWPDWIKMNIGTLYRPFGSSGSARNTMSNANRRNKIYQLAAANMFFSWGEVLAEKLEAILDAQEKDKSLHHIYKHDFQLGRQKDIVAEDFYDESLINPSGTNCPFALQNIVCLLLLEITSFLRETYQYMPKKINMISNQVSTSSKYEKRPSRETRTNMASFANDSNNPSITGPICTTTNSNENTSFNNLNIHEANETLNRIEQSNENISISINPGNTETEHIKHISFKFQHEDDNELNRYNLAQRRSTGDSNEFSPENASRLGIHNAKRHSFSKSFSRPSLKIRMDRSSSARPVSGHAHAQRKSTATSISINEHDLSGIVSEKNSMSELHDANEPSQIDTLKPGLAYLGSAANSSANSSYHTGEQLSEICEVDEVDYNKCFPWIKVVVRFLTSVNLTCEHREECPTDCFLRLFKTSHCLVEAVLRMYETSSNLRMFEQEEKEREEKEIIKKNSSIFNASKKVKRSNSEKRDRSSSVSSSMRKISYLNDLLKRNNLLNQNQMKIQSQILVDERIRKDLKMNQYLSEKLPTMDFITNQIQYLNQTALLIICKSVLVISDDYFVDLIKVSWNLLLNSDQELASSAAVVFIIGAIKQPQLVEEVLRSQLKNPNVNIRYKALLKFEMIWKFRYHLWPRLESNAHNLLKISPPCIEFVLPSPPVGLPYLQAVDPPWMPKVKTKVEEVTINQKEKAVVTASKSRKKHQQEIMQRAIQADEMNKKVAREKFYFTNLNYLQSASYEPLMHQTKEDTDEGGEEGFENANSAATEIQQSQPVFPASISTSVVCLIDLLLDYELNSNNQSISALADKIIWNCLIEDAALFLRYFFEKITQKDKKNILIQNLRRLLSIYKDLPPQTAYVIFNYLLGIVMFYVRSPSEGSQESVASILTLIWQIVCDVNGINFKDLKQTLKKEQCDPSLLITANVPFAKKLIVHGPDLSQIPTQSNVFEETQFSNIIQESFEFFGISENKRDKHFLFDVKTNQIHLPDTYVRNFYFFRRNFNPQLGLVQLDPKEGVRLQEKTALSLKVAEQSKVLFFRKILDGKQAYTTAAFLNDELVKLPMFPCKALEADFNLFPKLVDRELLTTDMLHKYSWCQLIWSLFSAMDSKSVSSWDISLFLNVVNGSFILHSEDFNMIRTCLAIYIKTARHFQHLFATNGFLLIIPSLIKVYSNTQVNPTLKNAIEFTCLQFYIMHRIPFILQLFGSVAQMLDLSSETTNVFDTNKIQASCFFDLLLSMETNKSTDSLRILELVHTPADMASTSSASTSGANLNVTNDSMDEKFSNPIIAHDNLDHHSLNKENIPDLVDIPGSNPKLTTGIKSNLGVGTLPSSSIGTINSTMEIKNKNQPNTSQPSGNMVNRIVASDTTSENYNNMIKALDLCYIEDDPNNNRFAIINAINLCVTVVAYATHANRANQMMIILDAIIPRYLEYLKAETEQVQSSNSSNLPFKPNASPNMNYQQETVQKARAELISIQKISVAIKTLVQNSDYLTRTYTGPRTEAAVSSKTNNNSTTFNKSPKSKGQSTSMAHNIVPDDNSKTNDEKRKNNESIDEDQMKREFRLPRDFLLNIVSEFIHFSTVRSKELYKITNDTSLKIIEFLDTKSHFKLVEIAHALLKLWDETNTLNGNGIQNYFQKLIPICDWTDEDLKPAFNNLLRRVDRLFTKISKRQSSKKQLDWTALAGILAGLYLTLDKDETISSIVYFKLLINSTISLILNEQSNDVSIGLLSTSNLFSTGSGGAAQSSKAEYNFQIPIVFSKALIKLIGRYISSLKDQSALEQLFGSSNTATGPTVPSGLSYMINFLLPLLFWSASDRKESPKLNSTDISFVVTILLNGLKPPSKLAATLLLQAPKQYNLATAFESTGIGSSTANVYNKSAKQLKDILTQSTFLSLKVVTFFFGKQIDLAKIALTIRAIFLKQQSKGIYLWRYIDFLCTNKCALFLLLKPFIENFIACQSCENEQELQIRDLIKQKINCTTPTNSKCNGDILRELLDELIAIKADLQDDQTETRVSIAKEVMVTEIPARSQSIKTADPGQKSASSSPSKSIGFKFNKSRRDSPNNENSPGSSTPRKKLERLNYKNGIDILEIYKQKCLLKNDVNKINVENNADNNTNIKIINASNLNALGYEIVEIKDTDLRSNLQSTTENDDDEDEDEKSLEKILSELKESKEKQEQQKKLDDSSRGSPSSDKSKLVIVRKEELDKKKSSTKKNKIIFV